MFQTFAIVFSTPENLLVRISGALGMKVSHFPSKSVFWENAVGYLRNGGCLTFQTFAIVFSTPENLLVRISGALGNKVSHFLSKNVFLRKCCRASQKQWMLELSNLSHCVQHPWKLTSKDFWRSTNESKPLSKQKRFWENAMGYLRNSECLRFQTFAIVFSTPENLLIGIFGDLGTKVSHFLSKNVFWKNTVGYLRNGRC